MQWFGGYSITAVLFWQVQPAIYIHQLEKLAGRTCIDNLTAIESPPNDSVTALGEGGKFKYKKRKATFSRRLRCFHNGIIFFYSLHNAFFLILRGNFNSIDMKKILRLDLVINIITVD
ncbi:MAG: hypothetical protein FWH59_00435 [Lentimicrobiaceae bacterium]|nr:hypothetical protein [Lentimicrobiaceae bacterium]